MQDAIISTVIHSLSTLKWTIMHPFAAIFYLWSLIWGVVRFPLLWANVLSRTIVMGWLTWNAMQASIRQFKDLCKLGRGIDGQLFSTSHKGAKADILIPEELHNMIEKDGNKQGKKFPVVILYSGGAWILGRRLWMRPLLLHFADAGFIAVAADYRQWPFGSMKGMIQDSLDSISWVFDQIEKPCSLLEYANADQVIVLGQSAGSHIASLALLELAKVRKEQMKLVAQGVSGCEKPYLHSKMKGVPLAFIGVGGMFDLSSTIEDLHRRGLHRKVLESLCENEPLEKYCAKSRATEAAKEARTKLLYGVGGGASATTSSKMLVVDEMKDIVATKISGAKKTTIIGVNHKNIRNGGEISNSIDQLDSTQKPSFFFSSAKQKQVAQEQILKKIESSSAVNFLPRFNLFLHGDKDISAPLDQAMSTAASYNDAAARHPHELVGEDFIFEKRSPSFGTREPYYILTPKPKSGTPVHSRQHSRTFSNSSASSEIVSLARQPSNAIFQGLCNCYAGTRAVFMSYERSTHTTLIVDDFYIEKTNPPLVVCTKALLATLVELEQQHAVTPMLRSPQISSAAFDATNRMFPKKSSSPVHQRTISSSNFFTPSQPPLMAPCPKHGRHAIPSAAQEHSDGGDFVDDDDEQGASPLLHDENDVENPFHYLCAPQSIAIPSDLFHTTFEKYYQKFENMDLRKDERPIITEMSRWMIQKVSAF